jgi:hypothetical protein
MFFPKGQQAQAVGIVAHDGLAVIAALNDMVRVGGNGEAGLAGHGNSLKEVVSLIGI